MAGGAAPEIVMDNTVINTTAVRFTTTNQQPTETNNHHSNIASLTE